MHFRILSDLRNTPALRLHFLLTFEAGPFPYSCLELFYGPVMALIKRLMLIWFQSGIKTFVLVLIPNMEICQLFSFASYTNSGKGTNCLGKGLPGK